MSNMVARMAASGSGPGQNGNPADGNGLRGGRILAAAAGAVALVYGGTLAWLLLSDNRLAGEPVVHLALAAPEVPEPAAPAAEPPADTADAPDAPADPKTGDASTEELSEEEQALLEAARRLDAEPEQDVSGEVRIVGAETVSAGGTQAAPAAAIGPLVPAPDPALVETTADGPLPKIARDGRKPWQVYAPLRPMVRAFRNGSTRRAPPATKCCSNCRWNPSAIRRTTPARTRCSPAATRRRIFRASNG